MRRLTPEQKAIIRNLYRKVIYVVIAVLGLGVLQNIDIIFAKMLFSTTESGKYAGIGLFSNAIYYIGFIIVWITVPELDASAQKHNLKLLKKSSLVLICIFVLAILFNIFIGKEFLNVVLGAEYSRLYNILTYSIIYQGSLVLIGLFIYSLVILGKFKIASILSSTVLLMILAQPLFSFDTVLALISRISMIAFVFASIIVTMSFKILPGDN
jgi:O-antigen/teichoic acid export membrane protein